jgi:hypothetical protein
MPQGWEEHWALPAGDAEAESKREQLIHTFGNLTLVTKKLNSTLQNGPWQKKRDFISQHSVLALNKAISSEEEWDETNITKRSKNLFKIAVKIWPYPA